VKQWNEKRKKTSLDKYGTEHPTQANEVKEKIRETNLDRYGVEVPLQNEDIKKKQQQTVLEKYGVDNIAKLPSTQAKMNATTEERYGVKHYNELPEMREWLSKHCKEWLAESWAAGGPNRGVPKSEEVRTKIGDTVTKLIQSGKWRGGYQSNFKGRFPAIKCLKSNPRFLSILEAKFHLYLNFHENVEWYNYEGLVIPYVKPSDGRLHNYLVDFMVKFKETDTISVFEIKTWKNRERSDVTAKYDACKQFCDEKGWSYQFLFEQDIEKFNITDEAIKNFPGMEIW
jgi:hypothetical protein